MHPTPRLALPAAALALAAQAALAGDPQEIIVPTDLPLSVALAVAQSGDTITLLPSGSPYVQFPGYSYSNKQLTIRGSTGNPEDVVLDGANLDIVLRITNGDGSVLENLTIQHGRGAAADNSSGAGLYLNYTDATIRNCRFLDNRIPASDGNGAGIYATISSTVIQDCLFERNTIPSNSADGAGVYFNAGSHQIINSTFSDNGDPDTSFSSSAYGGAVYADGGVLRIIGSTLHDNRSRLGSAVFVAGNELLIIDSCVFDANASVYGSIYYNVGGSDTAVIRNSLFINNYASTADAAMSVYSPVSVANCTFAHNTVEGSYILGGLPPPRSVSIDNCIFADNAYASALFPAAMQAVVRNNILQQAYAGGPGSTSNLVADPLFLDPDNRDFRLTHDSPAIDHGNSDIYCGPFIDLDANPRAIDVPDVPDTGYAVIGPVIDAGAYEFQTDAPPPPPDCLADVNLDGAITSQDFFDFLGVFFSGCP